VWRRGPLVVAGYLLRTGETMVNVPDAEPENEDAAIDAWNESRCSL